MEGGTVTEPTKSPSVILDEWRASLERVAALDPTTAEWRAECARAAMLERTYQVAFISYRDRVGSPGRSPFLVHAPRDLSG